MDLNKIYIDTHQDDYKKHIGHAKDLELITATQLYCIKYIQRPLQSAITYTNILINIIINRLRIIMGRGK